MTKGFQLLFGLGFVIISSTAGLCQQPPGNQADAHNPSGAPGPMQSPSIWKVDNLTGALSINLPINAPLHGGRGPHYGLTLTYNSASTVSLQFNAIQNNYANYIWEGASQVPASFSGSGPWKTSGPIIQNGYATIPSGPIYETLPDGDQMQVAYYYGCIGYGPFLYTDPGGAVHDLNIASVTTDSSTSLNPGCGIYSNVGSNSTIDSSGLFSILYGNVATAIEPDGTVVSGSGLEDSNGNVFGTSDAEGRTALALASGNCLAVGTCVLSGKDSNGNTLNYDITTATQELGNFTMPHPESSEMSSNAYVAPGNDIWMGSTVNSAVSGSIAGVTNVTYPDGTSYSFAYDPTYATVNKITFPTGGSVQFTWGIRAQGEYATGFVTSSSLVVTQAVISDGLGDTSTWTYSYPNYVPGQAIQSTVVSPDGTTTDYSGSEAFLYSTVFTKGVPTFQETLAETYSGGALIRSTATNYVTGGNGYGHPQQVATTYWDSSTPMQSSVLYVYDQWDNIIEKDESALYSCSTTLCSVPSGSWARRTFTTYPQYDPVCPQSGATPTAGTCPSQVTGFTNAHIVNKPSQVVITDGSGSNGSGHPYSITWYGYDETAVGGSSGVLNHDDRIGNCNNFPTQPCSEGYGIASPLERGNLTSEAQCTVVNNSATLTVNSSGLITTSSAGGACSSWLVTKHTYDLTGQMLTTTDPAGNTTSFSYGDSFSIGAVGNYGTSYSFGTSGSPTNSFLTKVTHPNGAIDTYTYDYYTGKQTAHTDWNLRTTYYSYNTSGGTADPFGRLTQITLPATNVGTGGTSAAGSVSYTYIDTANAFSIKTVKAITTTVSTTSTTTFDGLARPISTSTVSPQCSSNLKVNTQYDSMSRVESVTNPYCSTSDPTYGATQYAYDALGRKTQTTLPDGSVSTQSYSATATEMTDPFNGTTNVQHIQQADSLGRLTNVCEVTASSLGSGTPTSCGLNISGTGYLTTYAYDPLNNLLSVNQSGLSRTFTYDSLSRLTKSVNPEVGPDVYTYNNSSAAPCARSSSAPCTRTDNRGVVTSYAYDSMTRLTGKSYSVASSNTTGPISDLSYCYQYDKSTSTDANPLGHLTMEWQQAGACPSSAQTSIPSGAVTIRLYPSHDNMGRVLSDQQCLTATGCPSSTVGNFVYGYDLLGNQVQADNGIVAGTVTYSDATSSNSSSSVPSVTWESTYDTANHLAQVVVQDQPAATAWPTNKYSTWPTLVKASSSTSYDPFGHLISGQIGIPNGSSTAPISIVRQYDNRARISYEMDNGGSTTSSQATNSLGTINIGGLEQGPTYPASSYASATLTINGTEGDIQVNPCEPHASCPQNIPDSGLVNITINGTVISVNYALQSTSSNLASALAGYITGAISHVRAIATGNVVIIRSTTPGTAGNGTATLSASVSSNESQYYNPPSFNVSLSGSNLSGGTNVPENVYDSGTVSATVNGQIASVSFNSASTPQSIASALGSALQTADGSFLTAKTDGDVEVLVSSSTGTSTDWPITTSVTYDSNDFTSPSFTAIASPMADGDASDASNGLIYFYYVPQGGYAPNGNILVSSDSVMGDWFYAYDAVDRVTSATPDTTAPAAYQNHYMCWTYDAYGNRTLEAFSTANCSSNPTPQVVTTYNSANNQISSSTMSSRTLAAGSYGYDASGNTLYDGNNRYWFNAEGQMCAVQNVTTGSVTQYAYDPEGARVAVGSLSSAPSSYTATCVPPFGSGFTLNTRWLVDQGGDQVTELSGSGSWIHSNFWAAGRLTGTYDGKGIHFDLTDPLGTKRVQANASGQVDEQCTSLAFGNDIANPWTVSCPEVANSLATNDDATEQHFTQKERDANTGNDYFLARYYTSALGRFTSPDWSAKEEPVPYADLDDPQSLNLYSYVRNSPLARVDLDGHANWDSLIVSLSTTAGGIAGTYFGGEAGAVVGTFVATPGAGTIGGGIAGALLGGTTGAVIGNRIGKGIVNALNSDSSSKDPPPPATDPAPSTGTSTEGTYEFPDATKPGKTYVGQSGNVPRRLGEHEATGKKAAGTDAKTTHVSGGKTAREVAETKRIKELGGTTGQPSSQTSNKRLPVSDSRMEKIKNGSSN